MTYDPSVKAVCKNGTYIGFKEDGVIKFLGIPFARVKRWQRPYPVETTTEDVFEAFSYGPSPWQDPAAIVLDQMSEDCLNLNLYAADVVTPKKAVMVWVTGGAQIMACNAGNVHMDGSRMYYDPSTMVRENPDIIVLSINYRVGFWGTLALEWLPDFKEEYKYSPNLARLDLLESLKWVKANIEGFGGDPDNITLYGQSAGSNNITSLMFMEEAIPYFNNAICQSSFAMDISMTLKADGEKIAKEFFKALGVCTLEEALEKSNEDIYKAQMELNAISGPAPYPGTESKFLSTAVDGVSIKEDYWDYLMSGAMKGKTVIFGTNSGEYDQMFEPFAADNDVNSARKLVVDHNWGKLDPEKGTNPEYVEQYLSHHRDERDDFTAYMDMKMDLFVRNAAVSFAKCLSGTANTYMYVFDQRKNDTVMGRCNHGTEMEGLFDQKGVLPEKVKHLIRDIWTSVARTGNPNCESLGVTWEQFGDRNETLLLNENPSMADGVRMDDVELTIPSFREYKTCPRFAELWKK